ncbi:unnamed protein product [Brassica rapa subsp. trilocularis]
MCHPSQTPHLRMSSSRIDPPKRVLGLKEGVVTLSTIHGVNLERAVPSPSSDRHEAVRSRHVSSSTSPPTVDGFGTGTPEPSPQSQSFSQSYGSILLTSHAYIVPSTRGCSPWRPDAVMSTTGRERHSALRIFKGHRECTGHHATCAVSRVGRLLNRKDNSFWNPADVSGLPNVAVNRHVPVPEF